MPNANHKPKGRFFWSVGLYLTDIVIDIATNGAIFGAKWRKRGLLHWEYTSCPEKDAMKFR